MTKGWMLVSVTALLLLSTAEGHGAPEPRGFESTVLVDNTQAGDYGQVSLEVESVPNPIVANEAVDLLAAFAREAYGPSGEPGTWFRIIFQGGGEGTHRIEVSFDADQSYARFFESTDLLTWAGDADFVQPEAIPVGDGHPKAIEFFMALSTGTVSNFQLTSKVDGSTGDFAPGTYMTLLGVEAITPQDNSESLDFLMDGPDELFATELATTGDLAYELTVTNSIEESQFISIQGTTGFGAKATLSPNSLALGPGESAVIGIDIEASVSGILALSLASDYGGRSQTSIAFETETIPFVDDDGQFGIDELIPPGAAYEFTFAEAGSNPYHCHPHPFMTGLVTVQEGANPNGPTTHDVFIFDNGLQSTEDEMGFRDATTQTSTTTIFEGDTVRWTNIGTHPDFHNVSPGSHDGGGHDHGSHGHGGEPEQEDTPAPLGILALLGLAAIAMRRRQ